MTSGRGSGSCVASTTGTSPAPGSPRARSGGERIGANLDEERKAVHDVPAEQPPWLLHEAMQPFEAAALDPARRSGHLATDEAEADSAGYEPGARQHRQ